MITREEMYELVWSIPGVQLAKRIGISDSYITRLCQKLAVPRPPPGYWAKHAVGRATPRPPLPQPEPGMDQIWSKGGAVRQPHRPRFEAPVLRPEGQPGQYDKRRARPRGTHKLIAEAEAHLQTADAGDDGGYLNPHRKLLADVATSRQTRIKCLKFANELFLRMELAGHSVVIASASEELIRIPVDAREEEIEEARPAVRWSPLRPTVAYVFGVPIGLSVVETSEAVVMQYVGGRFIRKSEYRNSDYVGPTWSSLQDRPSGRLRLVAYSPFYGIPWTRCWTETSRDLLGSRFDEIVHALRLGALDLVPRLAQERRYFC
ncbi:hypothetical protein CO660_00225 [Rhizobium sp. L9]|uniref:hypothetical protein n=1 Tax=Rhizobium sp. L9 TaxID=1340738 RepID=UPI000BE8316E|nr:hypothetical protein [Rhizobium sp. L9]PDT32298.1 hypothetical protein CO660_00225 [Rhizobium sp. L9]